MTITLKSKYGLTVNYDTNDIISIEHDEAGNLYDYSELEGNGIKPDESVMVINFKDLTQAAFSSDWEIIF